MTQIKATVIQDSHANDKRIVSFELEYPRFIHSELMTHRVFSRNAASSRAIPIATMNENIRQNPAMPVSWGMNNPGMQSKSEANIDTATAAEGIWHMAKDSATAFSTALSNIGIHKQISNRITEPFSVMKTIVTSTEWDNWFELRNHPDAQPEIRALAVAMLEAMDKSKPIYLREDDWHLPYINRIFDSLGNLKYFIDNEELLVGDAKMLSVSCCAQVSYRKNDMSMEKALSIYSKLVDMRPFHASPFEHQATPIPSVDNIMEVHDWPAGVTHMDRYCNLGSGNFYGWIQLRQLM